MVSGGRMQRHATGHLAKQDGNKSAHLGQAIANNQLVRAQMLRQHGVFDRTKSGMGAHQEQRQQQHARVMLGR